MGGSRPLIGAALVLGLGLALASGIAGAGQTVEVEADRLQIDNRLRTASFEGNVRATYGKLKLGCDAMSVGYDEDGNVKSLKATGNVVVRRGPARATAAVARLDARLGLLVLEGRPVLVQGTNRLEGKRITVRLADGKLEVVGARGEFRLGGGEPR